MLWICANLFSILLPKGIMKLLRNMRRNFKSLDDRSKWIRQHQVDSHKDRAESRDIKFQFKKKIENLNRK